MAELNGWPPRTLQQVRRSLRMLASYHDPGEPIKASTVTAMNAFGVPGVRVLEVLTGAGEDVLIDDRTSLLTVWIDTQFRGLPPRISDELQAWIDVLREGTPRRAARPRATVSALVFKVLPFLIEQAGHYDTLRQVTRDDITDCLQGRLRRADDASALRNLFGTLKSQRLVFTNPTHRIRVSGPNLATPQPLSPQTLRQFGDAAADNPALAVVLALIGVYASPSLRARELRLDQIDLPNQPLLTARGDRPLDPFISAAFVRHLQFRHSRWPCISNPHLLFTRRTESDRNSVSQAWLGSMFRKLPATAAQLRQDRILEEAEAAGGDPLHLASMFGFQAQTGLRYARAAHPELMPPGRSVEPYDR